MIFLVISCLVLTPIDSISSQPTVSNPAAWIASLHDHEQRLGRNAWSWQELHEARAAVFDARYATPLINGWLKTAYVIYLQCGSALLVMVMLGGAWLTWNQWARRSWGLSLLISVLWSIVLWLMLIPLQVERYSLAVIKTPGVLLREGNGISYALTVSHNESVALAAGVEAQLLVEQANGWVQIKLRDGTRGWVPKDTVYLVER